MSSSSVGSVLVTLGIGLVVVGLLVSLGGFGWFGRLPGDIRIERDTVRVYIPFASMIYRILNLFSAWCSTSFAGSSRSEPSRAAHRAQTAKRAPGPSYEPIGEGTIGRPYGGPTRYHWPATERHRIKSVARGSPRGLWPLA